ncbi:HAD hydrolase family protein [Helicobacter sp. 11S03491-1]|uniref:KdsC family phosphatase n=1 Tax=Helicobacter sp. 11S03491-1 TaxID=1476196 RepID=UPI000BA6369E|nr:HAD hydrolase family protein [Helicobacter sp. 11S03491-1]PAF41988.1 3-deoxy-D-manno-octulosonate 8-phosphate phosphatase [Helicobacter sp. 11S03491-1]
MIELIVLDVDGTLTDGGITYDEKFIESKTFDAKDGLALVAWQKLNKKVAIISGRHSGITSFRAKELGISEVYMGIPKAEALSKLKKKFDLETHQIACIGDDLNDLAMFKECGLCFAPHDCAKWLKDYADVILQNNGGKGAVREMIEYILLKDGLKDAVLKLYQ